MNNKSQSEGGASPNGGEMRLAFLPKDIKVSGGDNKGGCGCYPLCPVCKKEKCEKDWERIGTPVWYRRKCDACDGSGEKIFTLIPADGVTTNAGSCKSFCSKCHPSAIQYMGIKNEAGYIYEMRYE